MKLNKYLVSRGITSREFAKKLKVSVQAVRKWRVGERTPRQHLVLRIKQATKGAVSPNDWY